MKLLAGLLLWLMQSALLGVIVSLLFQFVRAIIMPFVPVYVAGGVGFLVGVALATYGVLTSKRGEWP
jgi:hypothetical protein